ncbi:NAD-P-binding protein [Pilatotrama ljubarskyi]|nr:NAD-P-binding protein [Pilatotrama ljubarskyi]
MCQHRVWFITGTSTGLGRTLAELILEKGEAVVATARKPAALDDLVAKYPADRLLVLKLEVTILEDIVDAFARAKETFDRIDVVVNNAGYGDIGEVEGMDDVMARAIFDVNFWGATNVTRQALKFFRESNPPGHGGRLLQMSSLRGLVGAPLHAFYAASKFALEGMTESLAQEIDPEWNIKITLIEPGYFRTEGFEKAKLTPPHPAYTNPQLPGNQLRAVWDKFRAPGDPRKAMEVVYEIAGMPDPPLRFPIGKDAISLIEKKLEETRDVVERCKPWSEDMLIAD